MPGVHDKKGKRMRMSADVKRNKHVEYEVRRGGG